MAESIYNKPALKALLALGLSLSLSACISSDDESGDMSGGTDTSTETNTSTDTDTGTDTSTETDTSTDTETGTETGTDTDTSTDTATATIVTLSGTLTAAAGIAVDSDINDINASYTSNDSFAAAQEISSELTVQGFVTYLGTSAIESGNAALERFATSSDEFDYYYTSLQSGQQIDLKILDATRDGSNTLPDLDLYLVDSSGSIVDYSYEESGDESVTVSSNGDYYVVVNAYTGFSKYLLEFSTASNISKISKRSDFVSGEMLLRSKDGQTSTASKIANRAAMAVGIQSVNSVSDVQRGPAKVQFDTNASSTLKAKSGNRILGKNQQDLSDGDYADKIQTLKAIKQASQQDGVEYAEPNYIRQPMATTPDDTLYDYQWDLDIMELPSAWDLTTGERSDGVDVVVAVVDTGVYMNHEDLSGQLTSDGYDFISDTSISNDGNGIDSNPDDPGDSTRSGQSSWHGTHVAGTIAAATNNSTGIAGIAWNAKVMPVRTLGVGGGTTYDIIQGMYYAAGLENDSGTLPDQTADILNLSLGGTSSSYAEEAAVTAIYEAGVIIVAASGNDGTSEVNYPAGYDHVIAVGATDANDEITDYSNYGSHLDLSAPGGDNADANSDGVVDGIYSTVANDDSGSRSSDYSLYEGTSMAAPHVAGVIALMKAVYPELTADQLDQLIMAGEISDDLGASGKDNYHGYGRINALKAVYAAQALADGSEIVLPVILQTSPSSLTLGRADSSSLEFSNIGGGTPALASIVATDWLTVTASDVDSDGFGTYTVTVDRSGLEDGDYSGTIVFTTDESSSVEVEVSMIVGELSSDSELTQQYVLLLDENGDVLDSVAAESDGSYEIEVEAGSYYLTAGSDIDVDGEVCTTGETCGDYPELDNWQLIEVSDQDISGLDFEVELQTSSSATALSRPLPATTTNSSKTLAE